jgi:hypothetical protein
VRTGFRSDPRVLIIDVLNDTTFRQPGSLQASGQRPVFFPQPLLIDKESKSLLKAQLAERRPAEA